MHTNPRRGFAVSLTAVVLAASLAGCGTMKAEAESVFLRQNQVSSALMQAIIAAEMENPGLADQLYGQEAELQQACGPLQKAGYQNLLDGEVDRKVRFAAFNALRACAMKSTELAQLIWQLDPMTAKGYLGQTGVQATPQKPLKALARRSSLR